MMTMSYEAADEVLNNHLTGEATPHVLLHTGNPGASGTANVAQVGVSDISKKSVDFGSPENHPTSDERRCLSTSVVEWSGAEIDADQTISYASIWEDGSTGGVLYITNVSIAQTTGEDGVEIPIGDVEVGIEVFEKP